MDQVVQIGLYAVRAPAASGRLVQGDGPDLRYFAKGTIPGRDIGALLEPPSESFDYLDWIARLTSHIPERGAQLVHYFGVYANASHAKKTEGGQTASACALVETRSLEPESEWMKTRKKSWARMIKRVWETDPLLCECGGQFKVIAVIEARSQPAVLGKILSHLHYMFEVLPLTPRPPPAPPSAEPDPPPDDGEYCSI